MPLNLDMTPVRKRAAFPRLLRSTPRGSANEIPLTPICEIPIGYNGADSPFFSAQPRPPGKFDARIGPALLILGMRLDTENRDFPFIGTVSPEHPPGSRY